MASDLLNEGSAGSTRLYPGPRLASPKRYAAEDEAGKPQALLAPQFNERVFRRYEYALTRDGRCLQCEGDGSDLVWDRLGPVYCRSCGFEHHRSAPNRGDTESSPNSAEGAASAATQELSEGASISSLDETVEQELDSKSRQNLGPQAVPGGRISESWTPRPSVAQLTTQWEDAWPREEIAHEGCELDGSPESADLPVETPSALSRTVAEIRASAMSIAQARWENLTSAGNTRIDAGGPGVRQDLYGPEYFDMGSRDMDSHVSIDDERSTASLSTVAYPEGHSADGAMTSEADFEYASLLSDNENLRRQLMIQEEAVRQMWLVHDQSMSLVRLKEAQHRDLTKDVEVAKATIDDMRRANLALAEEMSRLRIEMTIASVSTQPLLPESASHGSVQGTSGRNPPIAPVILISEDDSMENSSPVESGGGPSTSDVVHVSSFSGRHPPTVLQGSNGRYPPMGSQDVVLVAPPRTGAGRLPTKGNRGGIYHTAHPGDSGSGAGAPPNGDTGQPDQGFESASNHHESTPDRSSSRNDDASGGLSSMRRGGPPSDPSDSSSSSSGDSEDGRRRDAGGSGLRGSRRHKSRPEASEIKIPTLPSITKYDEWCTEMADAVMAASGRGDKVWNWIQKPSQPNETFGTLKESGSKYNSLDAKLAKALRVSAGGNAIHHVRIKDEFNRGTSECAREGRPIKGRQLLLLVHRYYRTNEEFGTQYGPKHIYMLTCPNDKKLETFLTQWFTTLSKLVEPFPDSMLRDHFLAQMKNCDCMEHAIRKYNDLPVGHPEKTYCALVMAAQRQISLRRQEEMDKAIVDSLSGKAAPAHVGSSKVGHCKHWLKGGCAKGESCMYKHDPAKKPKSAGSETRDRASAKAAPATDKRNTKQGVRGSSRTRDGSRDGKSSSKGDRNNPDEHKRSNPCYEFASGKCTRGANCPFVHRKLSGEERERMKSWSARSKSRDKPGVRKSRKPQSSPAACAAYLSGSCAKGHMCRLVHVDLPMRQAFSQSMTPAAPAVGNGGANGQSPVIQILGRPAASSTHAPAFAAGDRAGFAPSISRSES